MEIRAIRDDEVAAFRVAVINTFGGDPAADPQGDERFRALIAPGRSWAAFDDGRVVGSAATFDFELTVPGGTLPLAGLTMVVVRPTHRRRGLLRQLMTAHLEEARGRAISVSGLWASEASIYGRFGYGVAAEGDELSFHAPGIELGAGPHDEVVPLDEPSAVLPPIYDAVRATRPGMITRTPAWWKYRRFADRPDMARGASPRRHALALRAGAATGYVSYRHRGAWEDGLPAGTVEIEELVAVDGRAEASLWKLLASVDLFPKVKYWNAPVDCVLPWIASDGRRIKRRRTDTLWLRIEDVPAALSARRYGADGALRLEIEGRVHELRVEGGVGRCAPCDPPAALKVERAALGSLYLGGFPASLLARAGRLAGDPAAIALADRMFAAAQPPWISEIF
jgi:predicted acetyltransferase